MIKKTTIVPPSGLLNLDVKELWDYKELFYVFAWRDIKVRYKQTALGILWVIIQPLISTFIFTILFGRLAKIPSNEIPYPIFVLIGLIFWGYFSNSLTRSSQSFIENQRMIQKIYFPRIILPLSTLVTSFVDFLVGLVILIPILLFYGYLPTFSSVFVIPFSILIATLSASGLGLIFASLNVIYRDVRYVLPFFIQLLIFVAPVVYPVSIIGERYRSLMYLNPMSGVIEMARSVLTGSSAQAYGPLIISFISSVVLFFVGVMVFNRYERIFADIL